MLGNLKPWKKGQSGNPNGRPPSLPVEIQAERKRNQVGIIKLMDTYINLTEEQARERVEGNQSTQIEEMIQGVIMRAKEGDINCFKFVVGVVAGNIPESDFNEFDDEDIEILKRVKQIKEQKKLESK